MRYLTPNIALVSNPHRVIVAGTSGSGKAHLAARIGSALQIPHIELDALHHGPGWNKRSTFERSTVCKDTAMGALGEQGANGRVLPLRANLLVWLDLSRTRVMSQVIERTLFRFLRRERLWNGNLEPPLWTIFRDRDHVIRWAWRTHGENRSRVIALAGERPDLTIVRLGDRADVERWVEGPLADQTARARC
jgi:adenylate kinase family enzyme